MGLIRDLYQLWQVRSCLPHGRAVRKRPLRSGNGKAPKLLALPDANARRARMKKMKLATVWLDGCSGCHMSFLDMDERLIELAGKVDLVYSPLVDTKEFPHDVDIALVEGAVSSEEDLHKIQMIRGRTKTLVSFGDCAVTANVAGMRNPFTLASVYDRSYRENATLDPQIPSSVIPRLLP